MKAPQASVSIPPRELRKLKQQAKTEGISLSKLLQRRILTQPQPEGK